MSATSRVTGPPMHSDVAIVGYGPTGMTLAALLGSKGFSVIVFERYDNLYNLPRAATFDGDIMRIFQGLGCAEQVLEGATAQTRYDWRNGAGERLLEIQFAETGENGWADWYMMYQPHLEGVLDRLCGQLPNVTVQQGHEVVDAVDTGDAVELTARAGDGSEVRSISAFAVGADGGNSTIRDFVGTDIQDLGFQEPWLVCDFRQRRPLDVPAAMQVCDPRQPTAVIRLGPDHRRFSFMLEQHEATDEATQAANVWARVAPWIDPDDAELVRVATYTFHSRMATTWRNGRILLAGDAAHEMPPFLGQGMCSGIRDADSLAWQLELVLRGLANDRLLDIYQQERQPHVRWITAEAIRLGRIQTLRDEAEATQRDRELKQQGTKQRLQYPRYQEGALVPTDDTRASLVGELLPQGWVESQGTNHRLDDICGRTFTLLERADVERPATGSSPTAFLVRPLLSDDDHGSRRVRDTHGTYRQLFSKHDLDALVVRPDRRIMAVIRPADQAEDILDAAAAALSLDLTAVATKPSLRVLGD